MSEWYDRQGKPIDDIMTWANLRKTEDYRRVGSDYVGSLWVSTVWVGIDMGCHPEGPPIIFETMAFDENSGPYDLECERYATEEEAVAGHARMVERVRKAELGEFDEKT